MSRATAREVIRVCRALAACSEESACTTRTFLSAPMRDVHALLGDWMTRAGMSVRVDHAGNLHGDYAGGSPVNRRLYIGSHLDTVPCAGAFDGCLGVAIGIALVDMLRGRRLAIAIEVVGFSEEEGIRFGVPFIGSRALIGAIDDRLLGQRDRNGRTVRDAIVDFGLRPDRLLDDTADPRSLGYVEFHIEQGPVLDDRGQPLGLVEAIVGASRWTVTFVGAANHAGTTPMNRRRDALTGAAEWAIEVEQLARATPGLVATIGTWQVSPGAVNVVPGSCRTSLDVRHRVDGVRRDAVERLLEGAQRIAARRGLAVDSVCAMDQPATPMDATLLSSLAEAAGRRGLAPLPLTSGAGHDAMIVAARMPAAMVFLRSPKGISHHPDESVLESDVAQALALGAQLLDDLSRQEAAAAAVTGCAHGAGLVQASRVSP
jgi:allantoate deiminase